MDRALRQSLRSTLVDIDKQISTIKKNAQDLHVPAEVVLDSNGNYVLAPLLLAKSQVLMGLAMLQSK